MQKPLVFVSHVATEKEIAISLKKLVVDAFIGAVDVFVASDPESISFGGKWLDEITYGLKRCSIEIVLASPASIKRPWISFEAGAGWVRDIPVVPLCHSGMTPEALPSPLSSLQGGLATDVGSLERAFDLIAKALQCRTPAVAFEKFIASVREFEETVAQISAISPSTDIYDSSKLSNLEIATLIAVAEESDVPGDWVWPRNVADQMRKEGYRKIAMNLGFQALRHRGMIVLEERSTGSYEDYATQVSVHPNGWQWLLENQHVLDIELQKQSDSEATIQLSDDIPF